jgi:hypothetical protein
LASFHVTLVVAVVAIDDLFWLAIAVTHSIPVPLVVDTSASGTCDVASRLRALIASKDMVAFPTRLPPFPQPDMMNDGAFVVESDQRYN